MILCIIRIVCKAGFRKGQGRARTWLKLIFSWLKLIFSFQDIRRYNKNISARDSGYFLNNFWTDAFLHLQYLCRNKIQSIQIIYKYCSKTSRKGTCLLKASPVTNGKISWCRRKEDHTSVLLGWKFPQNGFFIFF